MIEAISLRPKNWVALNDLAWLYREAGNPEALNVAEQALALNPDSAVVLDTLGWILLGQNKFRRAQEVLAKAVKSDPKNADIRYHWAVSLQKLGKTQQANEQLNIALEGERLIYREEALEFRESL